MGTQMFFLLQCGYWSSTFRPRVDGLQCWISVPCAMHVVVIAMKSYRK